MFKIEVTDFLPIKIKYSNYFQALLLFHLFNPILGVLIFETYQHRSYPL